MATLTLPYTFVPNTTIISAQVNANFAAIVSVVNGQLNYQNIVTTDLRATNTISWAAGVTGDTYPRIAFNTSQGLQGGPGGATAPDVQFWRSAVATWQISTPGGGAATLDMNQGSIINAAEDSKFIFGGASGIRALPTTGTLTGEYWNSGNWTQTGAITSNYARIHNFGTMTINAAWTVNTEISGGFGAVIKTGGAPGGSGGGLGAAPLTNLEGLSNKGGAGGGFGGVGGYGGTTSSTIGGIPGGSSYNISSLMAGSSGGGGQTGGTTVGGAGGAGGGSLYIESTGNISFTSTAAMTATGGAGSVGGTSSGSGGGGSGGGILIRSLGTVTLAASGTITAAGGAGGNAPTTGAAGGGGGGGIIDISGTTVTNSGTITAAGGAAGTGGTTTATAGSAGVVTLNSFAQNVRSAG